MGSRGRGRAEGGVGVDSGNSLSHVAFSDTKVGQGTKWYLDKPVIYLVPIFIRQKTTS